MASTVKVSEFNLDFSKLLDVLSQDSGQFLFGGRGRGQELGEKSGVRRAAKLQAAAANLKHSMG